MVKLISFSSLADATVRIGSLFGSAGKLRVLDVTKLSKIASINGVSMQSFIEEGEKGIEWLQSSMKEVENGNNNRLNDYILPFDQVKLAAPIPEPKRNIFCVGKNYKDHAEEVAAADKARGIISTLSAAAVAPQFFSKAPSTVVAPLGSIQAHVGLTKWLDFEAELAVIIGKKGVNIAKEDAMDYVYGYTIANDVTSRDLQRRHGQWFKGKTLDGTCPMGPYLLHKSHPLAKNFASWSIKLWLNNTLMQDSSTGNMIHSIPELIAELSQGLTLQPGDILLSGTPQGVGYARTPPILLKPGDQVAIEIENLGRLENTVA